MNNENEKIIKLLSGINAAQNEMIYAVSHRTGHNAEETAVLLRIFDLGSIAKIPADEIPERLKAENMVEIKADGSAVLTGKGAIAAKAMSISREKFSSQLLRDITPEERFVLINVLEKMLKNT